MVIAISLCLEYTCLSLRGSFCLGNEKLSYIMLLSRIDEEETLSEIGSLYGWYRSKSVIHK